MMGSYERKSAKSAVSELPPVAAPQGRIVFRLRDERRKQGLSLENVADALRIRKSYISAIENERFAELPGPTYALGFVGNSASFRLWPLRKAGSCFDSAMNAANRDSASKTSPTP